MIDSIQQRALNLLRIGVGDPHASFHDGQWEAIDTLLTEHARVLVVQRTGWGKSIVYFLATKMLRENGAGPSILISPLLALMRNQVIAANRLGIRAASVNSSNTEEWTDIQRRLHDGSIDVLLISPERLANDQFVEQSLIPIAHSIGLFVVDEAHCISDWGHDFRPDYRRITRILQLLPPTVPALATTATANDRVVDDIHHQLGPNLKILRGPLNRASLRLQNIHLPSQAARLAWLAQHVPSLPGSGIIYTLTVRDAQCVAEWMQSRGIETYPYWGDAPDEYRRDMEDRLLNNQLKALVATSALGMGFDKPDLGFVIHYQRPGSVIHYYQQVGRAGRAIDNAYGIMLGGFEDDDIADYFIRTAFPPEAHVDDVLRVLNEHDGMSIPQIKRYLNLSSGEIGKVLKLLATETPAPVIKRDSAWYATPVQYVRDDNKIEQLIRLRRAEQAQMQAYLHHDKCLMKFLLAELDDPSPSDCGCCAVCIGKPLITESFSPETANAAIFFLRRRDLVIEPRKRWEGDALEIHGFTGRISERHRIETGRALCLWGDASWGEQVKRGKQDTGFFDDSLVDAFIEMIHQRWQPSPFPTWVTCVPSRNHPTLVASFAHRVAVTLGIPFMACVNSVRATLPQKTMQNSYQQAKNLVGAFSISQCDGIEGPVLLIDDMVDSRWTFTVIGALLRDAGSGPVYPAALAMMNKAE